MAKWSAKRQRLARRRADGTFKAWPGGRTKAELPKQRNSFAGIADHIGAGFRAEHGRPAKTGDVHRTRKSDGSYHAQAAWYIKTPNGWRKSPTGTRKPSADHVRAVVQASRGGRPSTRRRKK